MAFQIADRVKETTTTTGTGTFNLGGAVSQFQTFVAGIGNGNETYYSIEDPTGTDWEVGIGTVTSGAPDTLSRDTVISSSNGGSLVNFGAGEKVVFSTQPASKTFILSSDNTAVISNINASTLTAGTVNDARLSANVTLNNASTISTGTLDQDRLANSSITINGTGVALGGSINVGDITGVTAGDGLTGGGTTGAVTLNVGAGTGIDVTADTVAVDVSDFMTNGANNRIVTATGTDAMNAETNLTFDGSTLAVTGGATFTANVALGDLDHILMGPTGEYQIYHDHANGVSVIKDADVGGSINVEADTIKLTGTTNVNSAYTLPTSDGTTGQALTTNGSGALSFTTITGTTINNNADNRVITGSGTANTLNGESDLTYDGSTLQVKANDNLTTTFPLKITNNAESGHTKIGCYAIDTSAVDLVLKAGGNEGLSIDKDNGDVTFTANVSLGDNDYLRFGASNDLQIYHNGSNSIIKDNGAGNLRLQSTNSIQIGDEAMSETFAIFNDDSDVKLYYDNSQKFATTATGISVTGTVVESSSLAYKENVQPLEFNEAIYNVNAVKYDRKDGSSKDEVGVIAEELYEVLPDLVECKDGKPDAVKYTKMTMYLLEALKKQNQEIQLLKEKLNG